MPGTRAHRKRLPGPVIKPGNRLVLIRDETQRALGDGARQDLNRHVENQAQHAQRTGQQARHVVAGHVLHYLPAEVQHLAFSIHQHRAEHEIARRARRRSARAGQAAGNRAAYRGAGAEVRRLEGQHLTLIGQRRFDFGQGRAAARRDHEFGRVVVHDAPIGRHIERLSHRRVAIPILGAARHDAQRLALGIGSGDAVAE